ncbi:MAG TPA: glycosyltransferase family 87 protein [Verrucomicrobiae bacterium]|nr:glycosyltransferase family 87 protein [Verrucomicrobiae bacterium]
MARWTKAAAWVFLAVCAGWYIRENVIEQLPGIANTGSDFTHYYDAARHVAAGRTPYSDSSYDYPPAVAFVLTPLAATDYVTARKIWFWVSQVFLLAAAWVTWRAMVAAAGTPEGVPAPQARVRAPQCLGSACTVAMVWAFGGAAAESLGLGQLTPLLVLLVAAAYFRSGVRQGLLTGVGASLKLIPGLLGAVVLLRRDRRAMAGLAAATAVGMVIPSLVILALNARQAVPARADYWMGTPALLNWSAPAVVLRAMDSPGRGAKLPHDWEFGNGTEGTRLSWGRKLISAGVAAAILLAGIVALAVRCRGRLSAEQAPWASAALISLGVAASPISWTHYQLLQYPGLAMLLCHAASKRRWGLAAVAVVLGAMLYAVPVAVLRAYYERYGGWTAWSPATLFVWTSVTPVAALGLFGMFLLCCQRPQAPR